MAKTNDPNRYRPGTRGHADALARQEAEKPTDENTNTSITASGNRGRSTEEKIELRKRLVDRVFPLTDQRKDTLLSSGALPSPTGWITLDG